MFSNNNTLQKSNFPRREKQYKAKRGEDSPGPANGPGALGKDVRGRMGKEKEVIYIVSG